MNELNAKDDELTEMYTNTIRVDDKDVHVRKMISFTEMCAFIGAVVEACFLGDGGRYSPEFRPIATDVNLIKRYTDLELPDGTDEVYAYIHRIDAVPLIKDAIDRSQLIEIEYAITERVRQINAINANELTTGIRRMYDMVKSFLDKASAVTEGLDVEELKKIANKFDTTALTEEGIVRAVLGARYADKMHDIGTHSDGAYIQDEHTEE